ncbi:MAG: ribonuclease III [Lachnospiraceae bacterium]|nr:ribonuclease III [Lachnospiraceae bacterium]
MGESLSFFKEAFKLKDVDAGMYSPLVLAYVGDAVYEIMIRTKVVNGGNVQVNKLHKMSASLVKAETQAKMILALQEELTEEEIAVYKRGRNAKSFSMAKNASMKDYRMATGFEALVGYLYLTERMERLAELVSHGLEKIGAFTEEK